MTLNVNYFVIIGLVPQQLPGFKSLRKETQKELIDAFPTQVAGYVIF